MVPHTPSWSGYGLLTFLPFPATGRHRNVLFHLSDDLLRRPLPSHFLPGVTNGSFTKDSLIRLRSLLPRTLNQKRSYIRSTRLNKC
jgi:hypothetical protein